MSPRRRREWLYKIKEEVLCAIAGRTRVSLNIYDNCWIVHVPATEIENNYEFLVKKAIFEETSKLQIHVEQSYLDSRSLVYFTQKDSA